MTHHPILDPIGVNHPPRRFRIYREHQHWKLTDRLTGITRIYFTWSAAIRSVDLRLAIRPMRRHHCGEDQGH